MRRRLAGFWASFGGGLWMGPGRARCGIPGPGNPARRQACPGRRAGGAARGEFAGSWLAKELVVNPC